MYYDKINPLGQVPNLNKKSPTNPVRFSVSELRFFFGPGYRIYYCKQGQRVVILLAGGDKSTQSKDIKLALQLAQDLEEEL